MAALRVLGLDDVPTADTQFVDGKFLVEWVFGSVLQGCSFLRVPWRGPVVLWIPGGMLTFSLSGVFCFSTSSHP